MSTSVSEEIRAFHLTGIGLNDCVADHLDLPGVGLAKAPDNGYAVLLERYSQALREQRGQARARFLENVRYCRDRMQDLLSLDDSRDPSISRSAKAVSASLGQGNSFFDSGALAVALQSPETRPVEPMPSVRRKRCEATLRALSEALTDAATQPLYWEFPAADQGAIAFCERQIDRLVAALRALRVARLEMETAYDAATHDAALARFDWESADAEELAAMPAVLVIDSADQLADKSLTVFGRLLRSGLPLQVLITCPRFYTGDLGFLAVAHREAFVLQSSLACPSHLTEGLMDMAHTLRPAVAVIATLDGAVLHESRTFPLFVYNPEAGEDWVQRFRLRPVAPSDLNAVHAAGVTPEMLVKHFRVIPKEAWNNEEQVEVSEYLSEYGKQPPLSIPYVTCGEQRVIVTRELAVIARDRQKAWRLFEELSEAGKPAVDIEQVKKDASKETIYQAIGMLTGKTTKIERLAAPVIAEAEKPVSSSMAAAPGKALVDPYIESELCTSCNDCMKINSRMFQYNGDKQAFIADGSAGTFAELVKAAEGCPASCIHPGSPREGDKTATPQLSVRAAKYN